MKGVQCYELFGGIALKNHAFSFLYLLAIKSSYLIDSNNGEEWYCSLLVKKKRSFIIFVVQRLLTDCKNCASEAIECSQN